MAVIRCLRPDVKKALIEITGDSRIHALRDCGDGSPLQVISTKREGRAKRAPTQYNIIMGQCVKRGPAGTPVQQRFQRCVVEWKQKKR